MMWKHTARWKHTVLTLLASLALLPGGCKKPAAPPPTTGGSIPIKVFVVRAWGDDGSPVHQRIGYAYSDNQVRGLVQDMIDNTELMFGQEVTFDWPGQVINELSINFGPNITSHLWLWYASLNPPSSLGWVEFLGNNAQYDSARMNIFFVPGIADNANPLKFLDCYTLDPAANNDSFFLNQNPQLWEPLILISDLWIHPSVTETIRYDPEWPNWPNRRIPEFRHPEFFPVHHSVARYLFRYDFEGPLWDNQERWQGALENIMRHPNNRAAASVWFEELLFKVPTWSQP